MLCLDKLEIIDIAQKIDTYDISIRPHEDCCTIFTPKAPATKPKSYKAEAFEATFDYETYVNECVENVETIVVDANYKNDEEIFYSKFFSNTIHHSTHNCHGITFITMIINCKL